ncbi:MAG: chemotaxis protein CheW [Gammaproteobacteria bacterium]|jgi:chemosensory pili system protein ChpC|nr:chemotaxis protein CheW [Gammaproteobacteria bacterium]
MPLVGEELYSLLIPLRDDRLIVPRACVAEVVRYVPRQDHAGQEAREWLHDTLSWREQEIPVIALEPLLGLTPPKVSGRTRVVVFNPLTLKGECPSYGILAQGFPQMVRVNSEVVQLDEHYRPAADAPVICQIMMLSEHALIPDLEALEARVAAALPAATAR